VNNPEEGPMTPPASRRTTRTERIHHRKRMIERARRVFTIQNLDDPWKEELARRLHDHLAVCSCWMCGNPRKYHRERTVQERRRFPDGRRAATEE
jgi:hypothetical protein